MAETRGRTLLVVEDNEITREGLARILARAGYDPQTAADGQQALDYLKSHPPPAVILMDMLMPVLDGWLFLQEVRKLGLKPKPCILVVTATPFIGRPWAEDHGCDGLIRKPIEVDALLEEIRRCLGPEPAGGGRGA